MEGFIYTRTRKDIGYHRPRFETNITLTTEKRSDCQTASSTQFREDLIYIKKEVDSPSRLHFLDALSTELSRDRASQHLRYIVLCLRLRRVFYPSDSRHPPHSQPDRLVQHSLILNRPLICCRQVGTYSYEPDNAWATSCTGGRS